MQKHVGLSMPYLEQPSKRHRLFGRCQYPVVFISVVVAMHRSLVVLGVIEDSVIVPVHVVTKRVLSPENVRLKNTSPLGADASIMPLGNASSENKIKKNLTTCP